MSKTYRQDARNERWRKQKQQKQDKRDKRFQPPIKDADDYVLMPDDFPPDTGENFS